MFTKVLIANRGEIAVRIIRACRELGIETVAVFSEADRQALHVRLADEAYLLGPAPSRESYLRGDKIIEIAKKSGADAIHPGYGSLAEREDFSAACADNDIIFIGPKPSSIAAMGDKMTARETVRNVSDRHVELVIVAPVIIDGAVCRIDRSIEPILDVVVPDDDPADHADRPEATAGIPVRILLPSLGRNTDRIPNAPMGVGHACTALLDPVEEGGFGNRFPVRHIRSGAIVLPRRLTDCGNDAPGAQGNVSTMTAPLS